MEQASLVNLKNSTKATTRKAMPWLQSLARFGYIIKGVIYCIMGVLAFQTARGLNDKPTDSNGALEVILKQPFGKVLIVAVVAGLIGYVIWRLIQAIFDPANAGTGAKGILTRLGYMLSGLAYALLAFTGAKLIEGSGEKKNIAQHWTAHFLNLPFGKWIVIAAGAIAVATGIYGIIVGLQGKFREHMNLNGRSARWLTYIGTLGYAARGIVFIVIGLFLMKAGIHSDPSTAKGMDGAQSALGQWSGDALYVVAVGLIAFGCFMFVEARYNRIEC